MRHTLEISLAIGKIEVMSNDHSMEGVNIYPAVIQSYSARAFIVYGDKVDPFTDLYREIDPKADLQ